ncbi:MAG: DUF4838 domain-containing protein [bacterium]
MPLSLAQLASAGVRFDQTDPVLIHAAAELRTHAALSRSVSSGAGAVNITFVAGNARTDGFELLVEPDQVTVTGQSARGVLNGVYSLLERLGLLWVRPGADGVRFIPGRELAEGRYTEAPDFPRRTFILGNDALHDEWREWLEFASRNRLNSVFFHDTPPSVPSRNGAARPLTAEAIAADGKGWMFERWDSDGPEIARECARRGMVLQFGGHHLPALLERGLFGAHPDWFPQRDGGRDARYNLCVSSTGGIAEVRQRAGEFFARFGGADIYHLWADDIVGGGWCACADCASMTPSDQALRATNVLAEELQGAIPGAAVAHLAYHDTIAPPRAYEPGPNVSALYAPRNRNYAFAINDPACPRNTEGHFNELLGLAETFKARPESLAVFEYYSDAILYKWMDPPNLALLPADARAYRGAGVFDFGDLAVSPRPWAGPAWHAWWFARCAWSAHAQPETELARFCDASFGGDGPRVADLYAKLDQAYRKVLDLGELERIPRHDVLDFSDEPRQALSAKASQLASAAADMNAAVQGLPGSGARLTAGLRTDLRVQLAMVNHLAERIGAWDAALDGRASEAEARIAQARTYLQSVNDWDHEYGRPAFANLSRGMLRSASWHTERIARLIAN